MSGSHGSGSGRDSYRGSDGGQGGGYRRDGGGYGVGGDEGAPYPGHESRRSSEPGGHTSGGYASEGYESGGYESGGEYCYGQSGSGPYQRETGPYQTGAGSGQYGRDDRGYRTGSGAYRTDSGGYRTDSGGYRTGSGSYRAGSGGYRTGSHRVVRERRAGRRWSVILGAAAAAVCGCALAAFVILNGLGASGEEDAGQVVGSGAGESTQNKGERSAVPDSCTIVGQDVIDRLAPDSERNEADNYQGSDRQNACVWGAYAGESKRQLTLELRAIAAKGGQTAIAAATGTFTAERTADESGKSLLAGQELTDKQRLDDVGDDGYVVYSVDDGQGAGEAIGNVRVGNVLITIHYSGSDDGDPLSAGAATDGAIEVAKAAIQGLDQS
ncbi:hypothetical protein E1281_35660 [Actinomadura sp. KC345]|uniref:hypothetical protein n=1 Tax=Actinomadura sp. KC345 TaxID=2530371 RepID=UPI001053FDE3|nr:hypothetical protein [Actinomadura sp. KC345]TDC42968.1 hypothetical protein E1281_35660 [Actinomadura sp. KC345]